jgi:putative phage-type endonuclease
MSVMVKQLKDREDWLKNRMSYIGGSDAAAVIGLNPYKSNLELWNEKTGRIIPPDISGNPCVRYGSEAEEYLRALFALDFPQYEVQYMENNSYTNDKYPFAAASLDGVLIERETGRKGILEIKTTNILQSMQKEKWNDRIPDNYFCQVLWYLGVTEFDFAILVAQLKSEFNGVLHKQTKHYHIERNEVEEDIKYLFYEAEKFWKRVEDDIRPSLLLPNI